MVKNKIGKENDTKQQSIYPIKLKIVRDPLSETWAIFFVGILYFCGILGLISFISMFYRGFYLNLNYMLILASILILILSFAYFHYFNKIRILVAPKFSLNTYLDDAGIDIDTHAYNGFIKYDQIKDVKYLGVDYSLKELKKLEKLKNSIKIEFKKPLPFKDSEKEVHKLSSMTLEIKNAESIVELIQTRIE